MTIDKDATLTSDESRPCNRCKGVGTTFHKGFEYNGKVYPDETRVCSACKGKKVFFRPDVDTILTLITSSRGAKDGVRKIRAAWPGKKEHDHYKDTQAGRAYFVWRMCRFHGGKDMTMPITANIVVRGDPFTKELDTLASMVAKRVYGTDMAAAQVWGRALGLLG